LLGNLLLQGRRQLLLVRLCRMHYRFHHTLQERVMLQ
jgi:hypothetical protein